MSHVPLAAELRVASDLDLENYWQMTAECFKILLRLLKRHTEQWNTRKRAAIGAAERLTATLKFSRTGRSLQDLKFAALISSQALA
jgi:hypothetical protein